MIINHVEYGGKMKNTIFYSWQSDLPSNSNRGYIESCIKAAIKQLDKNEEFYLDVILDRDTKDEVGTPDIANTIFEKIERSKVFIADVSIINSKSTDRKTPNPNVLIELGYAAKVLGWDKIICIFNTDYGAFEDLPFDIKFRRPLIYSLIGKEKSEVRKYLSKAIQNNIIGLYSKGLLSDDINEYIKVQADTQVLTIIKHLNIILFGYKEYKSFEYVNKFMSLTDDEIKNILSERKFLGFQVYKKFEEIEDKIKEVFDKITASSYYKREFGVPLANLIKWIGSFDKFNSLRQAPDLFVKTNESAKGFDVVYGPDMNPTNNDVYLLLERIDNESGIVRDFGQFQEQQKINAMLDYVVINKKYIDEYTNRLTELISIIDKWLGMSGGEFLIDNIKMFEFKSKGNSNKKLNEFSKKSITDNMNYVLNHILENSYKFDYKQIININFFVHLITYLFTVGQNFRDHEIILTKLNKKVAGTLSCNGSNEITIPCDTILSDIEIAIGDSTELNNNPDRKLKDSEHINITHIYITPKYLEDTSTLTKLLEYDLLPKSIHDLVKKIMNDVNINLTKVFKEILEVFIIENSISKEGQSIDPLDLLEKFDMNRIYHEKDFNMLNYEIRKYLNCKK